MTTTPHDLSKSTSTVSPSSPPRPVEVSTAADTEAAIADRLVQARAELLRDEGLHFRAINHFARPKERPFIKAERPHTTLIFGGLTFKHEKLIVGTFESLGYKTEMMPVPDKDAFQAGKEYGNNGQCNPTYFTVGN